MVQYNNGTDSERVTSSFLYFFFILVMLNVTGIKVMFVIYNKEIREIIALYQQI